MEVRKVQLSGGTTYTVSLPKAWARDHGIESGSLLYLSPSDDGTLIVRTDERVEDADEWEAVVDVRSFDDSILRELLAGLYVVGFDRIELRDRSGFDGDRRRAVTDAATGLSGLDVMEAADSRIVLRSLIDAGNVSIRKSVLRLRLVTLSMHRDATAAVVEGDAGLADRVIERDAEADRLFAMVTRYFRRSLSDLRIVEKLGHSRAELYELYYVARQLERVGDHAEKTARVAADRTEPPAEPFAEDLRTSADRARSIVERASDVILSGTDVGAATRALGDRDELVADVETIQRALYDDPTGEATFRDALLLDSVKRTADYGGNVAEMGIQRTMRETGLA